MKFAIRVLFDKDLFHRVKSRMLAEVASETGLIPTGLIQTVYSDDDRLRINIIVDSLNNDSLHHTNSTPIIFAMELANKLNCPLRIIVQEAYSKNSMLIKIAELYGVKIKFDYEFYSVSPNISNKQIYRLFVSKGDFFISTSPWSSSVANDINMRKHYILFINDKKFNNNEPKHPDQILSDKKIIPIFLSSSLSDESPPISIPTALAEKDLPAFLPLGKEDLPVFLPHAGEGRGGGDGAQAYKFINQNRTSLETAEQRFDLKTDNIATIKNKISNLNEPLLRAIEKIASRIENNLI